MDAVLIEEWLDGHAPIDMIDAASVALARQRVRELGAQLGLSDVICGSLVNVVSELGHNQLAHARRGSIAVRSIARDGTPGLEIIAADAGPGILAPSEALRGQPRVSYTSDPAQKQSLGIGLSAVLELSDETDFDVRIGEGTCVWARKFAAPVRRRRQIGIYGRAFPGELSSGDHAAFVRNDDSLLVALADGLGHGPFARLAANLAISDLREQPCASLERIFESAHEALDKTRGAVLAAARVHEPEGQVDLASVGNVATRLYGPMLSRSFSGCSSVLGPRGAVRKPNLESYTLGIRDVLILFSDGLTSRFELQSEPTLLHQEPIVIAQQLVERFARDNDDALVLVAR